MGLLDLARTVGRQTLPILGEISASTAQLTANLKQTAATSSKASAAASTLSPTIDHLAKPHCAGPDVLHAWAMYMQTTAPMLSLSFQAALALAAVAHASADAGTYGMYGGATNGGYGGYGSELNCPSGEQPGILHMFVGTFPEGPIDQEAAQGLYDFFDGVVENTKRIAGLTNSAISLPTDPEPATAGVVRTSKLPGVSPCAPVAKEGAAPCWWTCICHGTWAWAAEPGCGPCCTPG